MLSCALKEGKERVSGMLRFFSLVMIDISPHSMHMIKEQLRGNLNWSRLPYFDQTATSPRLFNLFAMTLRGIMQRHFDQNATLRYLDLILLPISLLIRRN